MSAPSDRDLVLRVVAGNDHHAYATLVRRHQSEVRGMLRRLCVGNASVADDLAQEVFIKVYRSLDRFRHDAKFTSWLYRIAYNTYVSYARKKGGKELLVEAEDFLSSVEERPPSFARHDLSKAMTSLRPEERAALTLTYGQDLSHEEAAEILGCPLGTLKTHVTRGKQKLRKRLQAWQGEVVV
ncbi:MAG: sigma-70 family RNA polymerase sigma factor [Myxococcales bacterium]|nr:sigma-70 family RNA polymerase sigma factor [Myxococcales bacterium]